jgi:putative transposase
VIPQVPVRQWVLSLPRWARFLLARDPQLITRTLDIAMRAIFAHQRLRARRAGALAPRAGAVTFVQRFGGALNLNVHFHCAIPDGVFVRENGSVRFVDLAPPSDGDVMAVLRRAVARLERLLRPRLVAAQADARPMDALGAAPAEAMHVLGTSPPHTGRAKKRAAYLQGFSFHAAVHLHANDREGLAHLCGYGARPPFSQERLSELPDGRLAYRLATARRWPLDIAAAAHRTPAPPRHAGPSAARPPRPLSWCVCARLKLA